MKIYATVDKDGNGEVTRDEFIKAIIGSLETKPAPGSHGEPRHPGGSNRFSDRGGPGRERIPGPGGFGPGGQPGPGRAGFPGRGPHGPPSAQALFERFDKDHNGSLTKDDVPAFLWDRISKADANKDGAVSKEELETLFKSRPSRSELQGTESKPVEKPKDEKPAEQKTEEAKPQARRNDIERPADAMHVSNVAIVPLNSTVNGATLIE